MKYVKLFNEYVVNEGIHDKGIFKAFFMAGASGSGKSHITSKLFAFDKSNLGSLGGYGLKLIDLDKWFEKYVKEKGYDLSNLINVKINSDEWNEIDNYRNKAIDLLDKQYHNYIDNGLGIVIDGTGRNYNFVSGQKEFLENNGYDTFMIFVDTTLEVAIDRNRKRTRRLPEDIIVNNYRMVHENLSKYKTLFGSDNIIVIDNNVPDDELLNKVEKKIIKLINQPVKNHRFKDWYQNNKHKNK